MEQRNKERKEQRNKGTKEQRNKVTKKQRNNATTEQRNKGTKEQRNKGTKKQKVHPIGSGIIRFPDLVYGHLEFECKLDRSQDPALLDPIGSQYTKAILIKTFCLFCMKYENQI